MYVYIHTEHTFRVRRTRTRTARHLGRTDLGQEQGQAHQAPSKREQEVP